MSIIPLEYKGAGLADSVTFYGNIMNIRARRHMKIRANGNEANSLQKRLYFFVIFKIKIEMN